MFLFLWVIEKFLFHRCTALKYVQEFNYIAYISRIIIVSVCVRCRSIAHLCRMHIRDGVSWLKVITWRDTALTNLSRLMQVSPQLLNLFTLKQATSKVYSKPDYPSISCSVFTVWPRIAARGGWHQGQLMPQQIWGSCSCRSRDMQLSTAPAVSRRRRGNPDSQGEPVTHTSKVKLGFHLQKEIPVLAGPTCYAMGFTCDPIGFYIGIYMGFTCSKDTRE